MTNVIYIWSGPTARLLRSWVQIPPGAWIFVCCECRLLSGRGLCDELITRPEESYRLCCVVVCDLETSRMGAPYIYHISRLSVKVGSKMAIAASAPVLPNQKKNSFAKSPYSLTHPVFRRRTMGKSEDMKWHTPIPKNYFVCRMYLDEIYGDLMGSTWLI